MLVSGMSTTRRRVRAVRHLLLQRRRLIAAVLLGAAVLAGLRSVAPPPPDTVEVLVATRDLPAGARLTQDDLARTRFLVGSAPTHVADNPVGRVLAGPIGRGEALTSVRFVGPDLAAAQAHQVVLPVRLPDAGMAALLRAGDVVDLYATDPGTGQARLLATAVTVLATPQGVPDGPAGGSGGALVVVGVPPDAALEITGASLAEFLTVALSR